MASLVRRDVKVSPEVKVLPELTDRVVPKVRLVTPDGQELRDNRASSDLQEGKGTEDKPDFRALLDFRVVRVNMFSTVC